MKSKASIRIRDDADIGDGVVAEQVFTNLLGWISGILEGAS